MKNLIKSHGCDSLPKGLARNLMKMGDEDNNGVLSFDEFYKLSIQNDWLIKGYVARYCKLVVPSPHRGTAFDEPGKLNIIFFHFVTINSSYMYIYLGRKILL